MVVLDEVQDLFAQKAELTEFIQHPHELSENFRNSRQVAEFAGRFGDISTDCVTGDGPPSSSSQAGPTSPTTSSADAAAACPDMAESLTAPAAPPGCTR